jgi:arylsulfatase A-like enzyme
MAREGVRLTEFYAAPSCSPARAMLLTGRYPFRTGIYHALGPDSDIGLSTDEVTVAEALKSAGYRTAMFGKWHLGSQNPAQRPLAHGFDEYFGLLYSNDMIKPWVQTDRPLRLWDGDDELPEDPVDQSTLTRRYTERAVDFIRRSKDVPFFLYVPYSMVHLPVFASESFRGRSEAGLYGDAVEELDWSVGEILKAIDSEGIDRTTLVVFTSDNGPWLGLPDRMLADGNEPWHAGSPGPFRGWKAQTYEGGVRVPCIARWPGRLPANHVQSGMASVMDLYTTAITLGGADVPRDRTVDGVDILPLLKGGISPRDDLVHMYGRRCEALRQGPWKLRIAAGEDSAPELYHLLRDPSERFNVSDHYPDVLNALKERLDAWSEEADASAR